MKSTAEMIVNYTAGLDPAAIAAKFTAKSSTMISSFTGKITSLNLLLAQILPIMNAGNIVNVKRPVHYNFAREIWHKVSIGVIDPALTTSVINELYPKYLALGCVNAQLIAIAALLNVTIPP